MEGVFRCKTCVNGVLDMGKEESMNCGVERVDSFVYLGNKLNAGGGCLSAVTARVRVGCMKFRELSAVLCGRKWSVKMKGKVYRSCVRAAMVSLNEDIVTLVRRSRLRWYGHVMRRDEGIGRAVKC